MERALVPNRNIGLPASSDFRITTRFLLIFWLIHIPLGIGLYKVGSLSLIHPLLIFALGMHWAIKASVPIHKVAMVVTYLVATEVLWRMAQTPIYWEFGKYGSVVIMLTAVLCRGLKKLPALPIIYFVALLPSSLITLGEFSSSEARGVLSFNMSGPLSLAAFCVFFANVSMTPKQIKNLLLVGLTPVISIATATLFYTISAEEINFTTESNFATSGGFGPNQVSSVLGMGAFFALSLLILFKQLDRTQRLLMGALAVFFAMQSVMTFSRSGVYNVIGATFVLILFHFQNLEDGVKRTVPALVLGLVFLFVVFPALDDFTGGKLQERFEETNTSNRTDIIESDLLIFSENPTVGIGVGLSRSFRDEHMGFGAASHTEFSRLISEHGSLGIIAMLCLFAAVFFNFKQQTSILGRAFVSGFAVWSFLYMLNAGMRLAAPGLAVGLTFITILQPSLVRAHRLRMAKVNRMRMRKLRAKKVTPNE